MRKVIKWLWWSPAVLVCAGAALRYWPARVPQGCIPYSSSDDGLSGWLIGIGVTLSVLAVVLRAAIRNGLVEMRRMSRSERATAWVLVGAIVLASFATITMFGQNLRALFASSANALGGSETFGSPTMTTRKSISNFGTNSSPTLGFSVGGAKDVANFRQNIERGFLPQPTDLTYEGLFYDYYFDTGSQQACQTLFCPSYATAVSRDPFSEEAQYFLTVGLNSGLDQASFHRKQLNLVVVLDVSGSMSSSFDRYYYDGRAKGAPEESGEEQTSKIDIAERSINALLDHLGPQDRFGLVTFDDYARVELPLERLGRTDLAALKQRVLGIRPRGGTNFDAGVSTGTDQFAQIDLKDRAFENRIVFMTDAMPNLGETSDTGLLGRARANSARRLYTTFVGMGVDFNSALVESITKTRGANYYSVHSAKDFKRRLDEEFDYMVTPLVFDLRLQLESTGFEIAAVYGSPEADTATGSLMNVATLFPSKSEDGETRGGVVLLKLRRRSGSTDLRLKASFLDRDGVRGESVASIDFGQTQHEQHANTGIRKAVLLARYADLMRHWMRDTSVRADKPTVTRRGGIPVAPIEKPSGEYWERSSSSLSVSADHAALFSEFTGYFAREFVALGDPTLSQDLQVLAKLSKPIEPVTLAYYCP